MKFSPRLLALVLVSYFSLPSLCFADGSAKINVNTATVAELTTIKGIGESKAAAIVTYREDHGDFQAVDALDHVPGIGPKRLAQITPFLTVGDAS